MQDRKLPSICIGLFVLAAKILKKYLCTKVVLMTPLNFKQNVKFRVVLLIFLLQSDSCSNVSEYSVSISKDMNKILMAKDVF